MDIYKHRVYLEDFEPNKTHLWIPSDSKDRFDNFTLKEYPDDESVQYYLNRPVEYKLNNSGFRTPDNFNSEDVGNVFLGDSHTFGIGLHLEHTWSHKLNKVVGGKFWNLGIGGTGATTHLRILLGYYKELNIKNIFHYAPFYPRYEFIMNGKPEVVLLNMYEESWRERYGTFCEESLINLDQRRFTYTTNTLAIKGLAAELGINYYVSEWKPKYTEFDGSLRARDFYHYSILQQHSIYEHFLKMYDKSIYEKYHRYENFCEGDEMMLYQNFGKIKNTKTIL